MVRKGKKYWFEKDKNIIISIENQIRLMDFINSHYHKQNFINIKYENYFP